MFFILFENGFLHMPFTAYTRIYYNIKYTISKRKFCKKPQKS